MDSFCDGEKNWLRRSEHDFEDADLMRRHIVSFIDLNSGLADNVNCGRKGHC